MKMKNYTLAALVAGLGIVGCATSTYTQSVEKRKPSSNGRIENTTETRQLGEVCGHAPNAAVQVAPTQVVLTSTQEEVTDVVIPGYVVYDCEDAIGNGSQGDWKGFYDGRGDKANQLANAIKGVGEKTAQYLVPAFQAGKPRSWREFSDVITASANRMERQYGINTGWATNVLKQYKEDNMRNLGYYSTACKATVTRSESYQIRDVIGQSKVVVEARIRGGKLLPNECESFSVSWNGSEVSGRVDSNYNNYNVTPNYDKLTSDRVNDGRKAIVTFKGERAAIAAPSMIELQSSSAVASGGGVAVTIAHSKLQQAMQVPEFAQSCKMSARLTVYGKKGSAWNSQTGAALKSGTVALNGNAGSTEYNASGVSMKEGERPSVKISTGFAPGCPFFSTKPYENGSIEN